MDVRQFPELYSTNRRESDNRFRETSFGSQSGPSTKTSALDKLDFDSRPLAVKIERYQKLTSIAHFLSWTNYRIQGPASVGLVQILTRKDLPVTVKATEYSLIAMLRQPDWKHRELLLLVFT